MILQPPGEKRPPLILAQPDYPSWGFAELLAVAATLIVSVSLGLFLVGSVSKTLRLPLTDGVISVLGELLGYGMVFGILWLMFHAHGKTLLRSLGWVRNPLPTLSLIYAGVALAILIVALSVLLRTPNVETPMHKLLSDKVTKFIIGAFGVTIGPIVEELLFRGFLQPVLMRMAGVFPGILITSVLFGSLHAQQYAAQWQLVFGVALVGFVLGVIRHVTGSTRASAIVHIAYNSVFFLAMLGAGLDQK